jgi:hypothetical protein
MPNSSSALQICRLDCLRQYQVAPARIRQANPNGYKHCVTATGSTCSDTRSDESQSSQLSPPRLIHIVYPHNTHTQSRSLRLAHLSCYSPLLTSSGTDYNQQMHENRWTSRKRAIDYSQISEETTKVTDHTFVFPLALVDHESGTHVAASI